MPHSGWIMLGNRGERSATANHQYECDKIKTAVDGFAVLADQMAFPESLIFAVSQCTGPLIILFSAWQLGFVH